MTEAVTRTCQTEPMAGLGGARQKSRRGPPFGERAAHAAPARHLAGQNGRQKKTHASQWREPIFGPFCNRGNMASLCRSWGYYDWFGGIIGALALHMAAMLRRLQLSIRRCASGPQRAKLQLCWCCAALRAYSSCGITGIIPPRLGTHGW